MNVSAQQTRNAHSSVDINVDGKQHGFLNLPYASARSAFGMVQIPVCVIRNGEGPIVTLLAGSRGDEFDGQVALHRLIETIQVDDISGCLIIAPTMNPQATLAQTRHTPVDSKDLDECFPGSETGSITEQMAAHIFKHLIEPASLVIEFQSGGASSCFTALAAVHFNMNNKELQKSTEQNMIAFGAPFSARLLPGHEGSLATTVQNHDKEYVAVRSGGGGSVSANCNEVAHIGCRNILIHIGMLKQDLVLRSTRMLEVGSPKNYVIAPSAGLLEMCKNPGDEVYMGNPIARIIQPGNTGSKPVIINADRNGILMAHHHAGLIEQGDCVAIVADEVQR